MRYVSCHVTIIRTPNNTITLQSLYALEPLRLSITISTSLLSYNVKKADQKQMIKKLENFINCMRQRGKLGFHFVVNFRLKNSMQLNPEDACFQFHLLCLIECLIT